MVLILQRESSAMDKQQDNVLRLRAELINRINVLQLTDYLQQQAHVLVNEDIEVIFGSATTKEKARTLIDIILTRGPQGIRAFIEALDQYDDYKDLLGILKEQCDASVLQDTVRQQ